MQLGLGWLRWTPDVFWNSTLKELIAGIDGYMEAHGMQSKSAGMDELLDMLDEAEGVEFPSIRTKPKTK